MGVRARAGAGADVPRRYGALRERGAGGAGAAVVLAADPRDDRQHRQRHLPGLRLASLLFLLRLRQPEGSEHGRLGALARRLPSAQSLDRLAYKTTIIGFPLFGAGVILGAIWAEAAWGRFWGWDPKETVSFITWVIYAAYLHARATSGWRDTKAAWINVAGFTAMLFNLFIINIVVSGFHSYAGLT